MKAFSQKKVHHRVQDEKFNTAEGMNRFRHLLTYMGVFGLGLVISLCPIHLMKPDKWLLGGKRRPLHFYLTGFCLNQMPLGNSIGGKSIRLLRVLSTPLMLLDRKLL